MPTHGSGGPVLVAYGSRYGSTAEIAELIGAVLREQGPPGAGHQRDVEDKARRAGTREQVLFEGDTPRHAGRIRAWAEGVALELSASTAAAA